ncbi:MAG TPA: DUF1566 domain-containing protein, partial [Polyangiales bacterium]|nr:DUF1566 domain-containing protein [Polyangiales bacterium]
TRKTRGVFATTCEVATLLLTACALPGIHRENSDQQAVDTQDASVSPDRDAAMLEPAETADDDAGVSYDPLTDPANRNEDMDAFRALVPTDHLFAEWPMPDSSEHAKAKPSYTVSEHVITDNVTKLRWQRVLPNRYPSCKGNYDFVGRLHGVGSGCTWDEARDYCSSPALAAQLGGGTWRLPTKIELESLIEPARINTIDALLNAFPIDFVWTSSPVLNPILDGLKMSWNIDFTVGESNMGGRFKSGRVRCVSSLNATGGREQQLQLEDVGVRDMTTGLVWQKLPDSATRTWFEASEYCEQLDLEGGGWHLPSLKELLTIVDPTRFQPAVNPRFFPFTQSARYWTSTEFLDRRNSAYQVEFERGGSWASDSYDEHHYVRCVR